MGEVYFQYNHKWNDRSDSLVTIITPVYNRRSVLPRTLNSIKNQTYDNFEYIIVNDGSIEYLDDIVCEFMNDVNFPVLYIKKENGGVHTARNIATKYARGYYWMNIDSDDELLPNAIQILVDKWNNMPISDKERCFEIRGCCVNQNGDRVGPLFPERGNMSVEEWNKQCRKLTFESVGLRVSEIMKKNLFPEPNGIRFVPEFLLWKKLEKNYLSYYTNDIVRVFHMELNSGVDDHLSRNRKNSIEIVKSACWKSSYLINNWEDYSYYYGVKGYVENILKYCMYAHVLKEYDVNWKIYNFNHFFPKLLSWILWVPTMPLKGIYIKCRM